MVLDGFCEHICEFNQNCYWLKCIFFALVLYTGLKWGVSRRGGNGGQGGQSLFVGAFAR